jgi:hypothetical protein
MVKFENALDVRPLDDGRNWLVLEDFYYDTDVSCGVTPSNVTHRIEVPAGFITDFASIPRPLWALVGGPADGKYRKIAVIHDYLYRTRFIATRKQADDVLLEGMKFSGCSWFQRTIIYSGVRVGGSGSYKGEL